MIQLIVIIGITGTQVSCVCLTPVRHILTIYKGASVADVFLQEPGWRIRGITRDTTKESSKLLEAKGIEMVAADIDDPSTLTHAFEGAQAIFGVTDFWQPMVDPRSPLTRLPGQSFGSACYDLELRRGKNIAEAANKVSTLERFVFSTVSGAKKWSQGKYSHVNHFDSKAAIVDHIRENLPDLAEKMSTVQIGLYATNWKFVPFTAPRKQPDGTYVVSLCAKPDTPLPMIYTRKDTGYLVRALIQVPPGKNLLGFGSLISWSDYMKLWGEILGVPTRYEQVDVDTAAKFDNGERGMGFEVAQGFAYMGEFGYDGGDPSIVHPKDLGVECPTTSIETYIRNEDWSAIL
ncbi:hypothetical protein DXG01_003013 [Tephrocybe rancida]|nr:hypothetical protein DXG01_003013 [Tephrocybe rancida]